MKTLIERIRNAVFKKGLEEIKMTESGPYLLVAEYVEAELNLRKAEEIYQSTRIGYARAEAGDYSDEQLDDMYEAVVVAVNNKFLAHARMIKAKKALTNEPQRETADKGGVVRP